MDIQSQRGIRKTSAIIAVAVLNTPENLYLLTPGIAGGGAPAISRTVVIKKIWAWSAVGAAVLRLGTGLGVGYADLMPPMAVVNGVDNHWTEWEIPEAEAAVNITMQATVAGVQVQIEVEERSTI